MSNETLNKEVADSTFAERLNAKKEAVKEQAFKRGKPAQYTLSDADTNFAVKTISLCTDPTFKALCDFENMKVADMLSKAFDPPPETWFKSESFGEMMAFKKGLIYGLQLLKIDRDRIWHAFMQNQKQESEEQSHG